MKRTAFWIIISCLAIAVLVGTCLGLAGCKNNDSSAPIKTEAAVYLAEIEAAETRAGQVPVLSMSSWFAVSGGGLDERTELFSITFDNPNGTPSLMHIDMPESFDDLYYVDGAFIQETVDSAYGDHICVTVGPEEEYREVLDVIQGKISDEMVDVTPENYSVSKAKVETHTEYTIVIRNLGDQVGKWLGKDAKRALDELLNRGNVTMDDELKLVVKTKSGKVTQQVVTMGMTIQRIPVVFSAGIDIYESPQVYVPQTVLRFARGVTPEDDPVDSASLLQGVSTQEDPFWRGYYKRNEGVTIYEYAYGTGNVDKDYIIKCDGYSIQYQHATSQQPTAKMTFKKYVRTAGLGCGLVSVKDFETGDYYEVYSLATQSRLLATYGTPVVADQNHIFVAFHDKDHKEEIWAYDRSTMEPTKICTIDSLPDTAIDPSSGTLLISWYRDQTMLYKGIDLTTLAEKWQGSSDRLFCGNGWMIDDGYFQAYWGLRISSTDGTISTYTPSGELATLLGTMRFNRIVARVGDCVIVETAMPNDDDKGTDQLIYRVGDDHWIGTLPTLNNCVLLDDHTLLAQLVRVYLIEVGEPGYAPPIG